MRTLPFADWYTGLNLVGRPVNRDAERTEYAQRKAGRGIRLVTRNQMSVPARTVRGEMLPIRAYDLARFS